MAGPMDGAGTVGIRMARWLLGFTILCAFNAVGELLMRLLGWPVPGAIAGMILLLAALMAGTPRLEALVRPAAGNLLTVLPLLLVPLAVGVIDHFADIGGHLLAYIVTLLVAWLACALTGAGVFLLLRPRKERSS